MKGFEMRQIRKDLGLDKLQLARLIGYTGSDRNCVTRISTFERDKHQIPLNVARLVDLIFRFYLMFGKLPDFPDWPGYDYESEPDPQHQKEPVA